MKNSIYLGLMTLWLLSGCMEYLTPKPTINVYYLQDANQSNYPIVKATNSHISVSTANKVKATPSRKIQLYFVYREGCPACEQLTGVMHRADIAAILDRDFEITRVNIRDKDALPKIWMRPFRTPTVYFLNKKQEELISSIHNMSARRFKTTLLEAIEARDLK